MIVHDADFACTLDMPELAPMHINFKEPTSVLLAMESWGHLWSGSKVLLFTDNMAAKGMINKGSTKMTVLHQLLWL